ncbi:MAG: hypothetical protein JXR73_06225 [Candidatus Omnitrophica bacterium]|nr:hypothetical protein [Candidatus Omnitrophota bacterium]
MGNELKIHPAADKFPMMDSKRYESLREDIRVNGLREPIILMDGMILDGRNRYMACRELGVKPKTINYKGNPFACVWSLNGERRDLLAEQRYLIWLECDREKNIWEDEQNRIKERANQKRSEATTKQHEVSKPYAGEKKPEMVVQQNVGEPSSHTSEITKKKAEASKTNAGAVARGNVLDEKRPDLAEKVRMGEMKPAEAHREMKRDQVKKKCLGK